MDSPVEQVPLPEPMSFEPPKIVDGATGHDDGGREEGDVELALFHRIRSLSNVSGLLSSKRTGTRGSSTDYRDYRQYFRDPLSMFQGEAKKKIQSDKSDKSQKSHSEDELSHAIPNQPIPNQPTQLPDLNKPSIKITPHESSHTDLENASAGLQKIVSTGVAWRDAMVQACCALLGKTLEQLQQDYNVVLAASTAPNTAFASETCCFEPAPRDLADYAIMSTLKVQDAFAMQNATSWLFNMMDRTGAGYVFRDEFIRYAPFIGPVADAAVAEIVFDELVKEQVRAMIEGDSKPRPSDESSARSIPAQSRAGIRLRKPISGLARQGTRPSQPNHRISEDVKEKHSSSSSSTSGTSASSYALDVPSQDMYPPATAVRFDIWRRFFLAVQDKAKCQDADWARVKIELGIDPSEVLIKSQGALDHSDVFPTLGKLYLTQRYLIFFAAVGRNHYVARLGAVAAVSIGSIPIMMRDCIQVHLESETKAAIDGVSAAANDSMSSRTRSKEGGQHDAREEPTLSQHVGRLMRQFAARKKPLLFSLLEFRETKRRDNWVNLTREMVAAHKLHVQLGFGSSGRAVPSLRESRHVMSGMAKVLDGMSEDDEINRNCIDIGSINYSRSPYRSDPSPPLLAVAAHANIVRYRSLRRVTNKHVSSSLLIFSYSERNVQLVKWYADSVRTYNNQSGRTWIERALAAIRENMDTNDRIYRVQDEEPFDVGRLGDAIGRFAELCSPMVAVIQFFNHLFQWRNPPATTLAIIVCITISINGMVHYVPAGLMFFQAAWVVETKYNWLGLGMGRFNAEEAEKRQANVLALVAQVHDTLAAAQNVLGKLNKELGKLESLFLWGCEEWQSWVAVGGLCTVGVILLVVPTGSMFLFLFFFLFFRHFLPPTNAGTKFWQAIPSRNGKSVKLRPRVRGRRKIGSEFSEAKWGKNK